MWKKALCLIFAFLLSINSFAAVVSDNDGSAFITKAEFDSLKNNFQTQLDSYNTQIDSKIDSAISSYLAGVYVGSEPTNLYDRYVSTIGHKPYFYNSIPGSGSATQTPAISVQVNRSQAYDVYKYLTYNLNLYIVPTGNGFQDDAVLSFGNPPWASSYSTWTMVWYRKQFQKFDGSSGSMRTSGALSLFSSSPTGDKTAETRSFSTYRSESSNGSGSGWIFQNLGYGRSLKYYDTELWVNMALSFDIHKYKDFATLTSGEAYTSDNGKADEYDYSITLPAMTTLGTQTSGTKKSASAKENGDYYEVETTKHELRNPGNWLESIIATNTNSYIYGIDEGQSLVAASSTTNFKIDNIVFIDTYYTRDGGQTQTNKLGSVSVDYYKQTYTMNNLKINTFAVPDLSNLVGYKICHGEGFPFAKITNVTKKLIGKIKFSSNGGDVAYKISKNPLINGNFKNNSDKIAEGTVTSGSTVTFDVENLEKDEVIFVNCYSTISGNVANIDSVGLTV